MGKKYIFWIGLLIIIIGGFLIYRYNYKGGSYSDISESVSPSSSVSPKPNGTVGGALTYTQALKLYPDNRIQFDAMCQTTPKNPVYKNNTKVMFDNRSGDARWISLNGKAYHLNGYGFAIITLSGTKLPYTISVDCGSAKNVAIITLQ